MFFKRIHFLDLLEFFFVRLRVCEIARRCYVVWTHSAYGQYPDSALHSQIIRFRMYLSIVFKFNYFQDERSTNY